MKVYPRLSGRLEDAFEEGQGGGEQGGGRKEGEA
jgi:hypothetical protein